MPALENLAPIFVTAIQTDGWGSELCHRTFKIHMKNDLFMNIMSHQSQGSRREKGRMIAWKDMNIIWSSPFQGTLME